MAAGTATWADLFLEARDPDHWTTPEGFPPALVPHSVFFQRYGGGLVASGLEVVVASAGSEPAASAVRAAYLSRRGGRAAPVLIVAGYPSGRSDGTVGVSVCGPVGESPSVVSGLDLNQIERVADCALGEPDRHSAVRLLQKALSGLDAPEHARLEVGLRNQGLLAPQELRSSRTALRPVPPPPARNRAVVACELRCEHGGAPRSVSDR